MEDHLSNKVRDVSVSSYAAWTGRSAFNLPKTNGRCFRERARRNRSSVPRGYSSVVDVEGVALPTPISSLSGTREARLFVKLSKCELATQRVQYLGFVIELGEIKPDTDKVSTVRKWPVALTDRRQLPGHQRN